MLHLSREYELSTRMHTTASVARFEHHVPVSTSPVFNTAWSWVCTLSLLTLTLSSLPLPLPLPLPPPVIAASVVAALKEEREAEEGGRWPGTLPKSGGM
jgi:hypothetical protein